MTYLELKTHLDSLTDEALEKDVVVYLEDEDAYCIVLRTGYCDDGELDDGHLYLALTEVYEG